MTLPNIEIVFKQLASSAIARSERGIAVLIINDTTTAANPKTYKNKNELVADKAQYTLANYQQISDVISFAPSKVIVVKIGTDKTLAEALKIVEGTVKTGWVTYVTEQAADYKQITAWIKTQNEKGRSFKAIVTGATAPNNKHIVWLGNTKVTFKDDRGEKSSTEYLPSMAGILASCNIAKGSTSFNCNNLIDVLEPNDINADLTSGKLVLINDFDCVRIGRGINSMTTLGTDDTEDMKFIDIVEAMDLIKDDIENTFKSVYQGAYKNSMDNQTIFISAVNSYFAQLGTLNILDNKYHNHCDVDTEKQRKELAKLYPEAVDWDDNKVKDTTYKRNVFLVAYIKMLGSMEELSLAINIF